MKRIGLLSDTHGHIHPKVFEFFSSCDEIWHAGDIGNYSTAEKLAAFKPFRAVYGNIDGIEVRQSYPQYQSFLAEEIQVLMTHIGGYPGRYEKDALIRIREEKPALFVAGHSHILKVIYDQKHQLLHMNPGAAGNSGLHQVITLLRFVIEGKEIKDLEICEIPRKSYL